MNHKYIIFLHIVNGKQVHFAQNGGAPMLPLADLKALCGLDAKEAAKAVKSIQTQLKKQEVTTKLQRSDCKLAEGITKNPINSMGQQFLELTQPNIDVAWDILEAKGMDAAGIFGGIAEALELEVILPKAEEEEAEIVTFKNEDAKEVEVIEVAQAVVLEEEETKETQLNELKDALKEVKERQSGERKKQHEEIAAEILEIQKSVVLKQKNSVYAAMTLAGTVQVFSAFVTSFSFFTLLCLLFGWSHPLTSSATWQAWMLSVFAPILTFYILFDFWRAFQRSKLCRFEGLLDSDIAFSATQKRVMETFATNWGGKEGLSVKFKKAMIWINVVSAFFLFVVYVAHKDFRTTENLTKAYHTEFVSDTTALGIQQRNEVTLKTDAIQQGLTLLQDSEIADPTKLLKGASRVDIEEVKKVNAQRLKLAEQYAENTTSKNEQTSNFSLQLVDIKLQIAEKYQGKMDELAKDYQLKRSRLENRTNPFNELLVAAMVTLCIIAFLYGGELGINFAYCNLGEWQSNKQRDAWERVNLA